MAETYAVSGPTFKSADGGMITLPRTGQGVPYSEGSDAYANAGRVISFYHLPSERVVYFKAFITAFNETFASDWAQESVYGRSDPIYMFKQTKRNVNLAFKIPAASTKEAYENLARVQALAQFLYPTYEDAAEAQTITHSPLIRLKVMNLLRKNENGQSATNVSNYPGICGGLEGANGILGVIESVAIDHGLAALDGVVELANPTVLSKLIEVNLNFSVIHEHSLGWQHNGEFAEPGFPYGAATKTFEPTPAPASATGTDPNPHTPAPTTSSPTTPDNAAADAVAPSGFILTYNASEERLRAYGLTPVAAALAAPYVGLDDPLESRSAEAWNEVYDPSSGG